MPPFRLLPLALLLVLTGCHTADSRIRQHATEFAALDPSTQKAVRDGVVQPGYTTGMVFMALGKPAESEIDAQGQTVWVYHEYPVTAYNETIMSGYRRRVVYDPVKRGDDVIIEPIDPKAFPNLVPHTLRLTFRHERLVGVERLSR